MLTVTTPLFFFSYATDDADPWLGKIFAELESEVRRLRGVSEMEAVGFKYQRDNEPGDDWPAAVVTALMNCRVIVPAYSPSYFSRLYCGREIGVFLSRCNRYMLQQGGRTPTAILPFTLVPLRRPVPERVTHIEFAREESGAKYAGEGLRYIRKLKRHRDEYWQFIHKFAKRIVDVVDSHTLPTLEPIPDITTFPSAFEELESVSTPAPKPIETGPRVVNFVYVTAAGDGAWRWAPYPPPDDNRIGRLTFDIALGHDFQPRLLAHEDLLAYPEKALAQNEIIVVLVDSTSLRDDRYRALMEGYDRGPSYINCAALVIWPSGIQTQERAVIETHVRDTFRHKRATTNAVYFRSDIETSGQLRRAIEDTLINVQMEVLGRATDHAAPSSTPLPILDSTAVVADRG
jgi:hypothetical protein